MSTNTPVGTAARPLRIAVVGSGPAGVYAADILTKSEAVKSGELTVSIDLFDRYPAPYGLIRYGVAPDHPRIKGIVNALHKVLDRGDIRFFGNVDYGTDLSIEDLRTHYDAVIFATGAIKDADLNIPGIELEGSYGGADFVSWYDGHPDVPRDWPLDAKEIAVIGNGNVALDVARMLSKHADDLLVSEIPDNVYAGLKASPGHGRARLRPPRPRPGEVHPAGAARTVPLQGRGHHPLRRGLRVRRRIGPPDPEQQPDQDHGGHAHQLDRRAARGPLRAHGFPPPAPALPAQPGGGRTTTPRPPAASPGSSSSARSWTARGTPAAPASSSTTRSRPSTAPSATSAPRCPRSSSTTARALSRTTAAASWTPPAPTCRASTPPAGSSAARSA